ncbi:MAG: transglutaminaseTgpA domain-containing protein, partial [Terriglobales bacterium]
MAVTAKSVPTRLRSDAPAFNAAINRFFDFSLFLLIVTGFATLAATGRLDPVSIVAGWTALGLRGFLLLRNRRLTIPERWTTFLTVFYVAFYAADYLFLSASFVTATVHMVLFIMIVKMFSVQRERDHVYLAVLSFMEVLAAAVLTVDTTFFIVFCVFTVVAVATFVSMEMR